MLDFFQRICPGRQFAKAGALITTASVLACFDITQSPDDETEFVTNDPMKPIMMSGMTMYVRCFLFLFRNWAENVNKIPTPIQMCCVCQIWRCSDSYWAGFGAHGEWGLTQVGGILGPLCLGLLEQWRPLQVVDVQVQGFMKLSGSR